MHLVQEVHAIFLAGGSAFGLAVGDGVMRYLEEQGMGYPTPGGLVPIVPGAILYDLDMGDPKIRPDAAMGYQACLAASPDPIPEGSVGAGTGARVGGFLGKTFATKGGLGSAGLAFPNGLKVAALFAVNAVGDVLDEHGAILAGVRQPPHGEGFADALALLTQQTQVTNPSNTVIGVVATNAKLTKEEVNKVAQMAQDGLARAIRPSHTPYDGDTIFALATGQVESNLGLVGALAAEVTSQAIRRAVRLATSLDGVPAIHPNGLSH
jgi:L-aminopeptidase/D-esterase-like protein